jgi:hypothetical protein
MKSKMISVTCAALLAGAFVGSKPSFAQTPWQHHHPWRVEVNSRLHNQNRRIDAGLRDHQLTRAEVQQLRSEDRNVLDQERVDAAGHDSHLTGLEKRQLNHEENGISGQIHSDRVVGN